MKLQVAIDRISLNDAVDLANRLDGIADIIEFGTSLVKDYGFYTLKKRQLNFKMSKLLLDIKTIDEASYEFEKGYTVGADILTAMGTANISTLDEAYKVAEKHHKQLLIDLMAMNNNKMRTLKSYPNAIYNIHNSFDNKNNFDAVAAVKSFKSELKQFDDIKIAIAGGINLNQAEKLVAQNVADIMIVGGSILKAKDPIKVAKKFKEVINNGAKFS